ncbi:MULTISPECIES: HAD-IA family hydrolase [unclassified Streptomyces]|uniref:HAD family hydrolase n=1 Tax=unclassified Streptomyces TaxID=2593676 RepID=UPI0006FD67E0|nr:MULTISPECIES: HAD-IA family hydrolase [unclassified Streptomyces]KQX46245.1 hydrolase [Streptomyces sp. Root1304]KRA81030.1 hydrolase [Streptomyces sp. Root66D1]
MNGRDPGSLRPAAVVLDTDGVLLDSAAVHARAWKTAFDACLGRPVPGSGPQPPFDADSEYRGFVDGRSRYDGAAAFLAARGLHLPPGEPDDVPGCGTVWAVAARKEQAFVDLLRTEGVTAFADAGPALAALRTAGVPCAAVSASRHARALIHAAGLAGLLAVIVDGEDAARLGLAGKPDPALFLRAAAVLGSRPRETVVVEDALAGVEAARRGGFGLVAGVDRSPLRRTAHLLREQGADLVVPDLTTLVRSVWGEPG